MGSRAEKRSISRRTWVASLVESPVAFNDLRAPHPRRAALVRVTLSSRPSMSLNFRASSTRNTLHDADVRNTLHDDDDVDDVNSDVQVPVTLLQMSPLDDDVDNVPWSLQRASATRCALHAAVDAPTAASVVDAMRGGGAYWGSLCACELFY